MRLRNITGSREVISGSPYVIKEEMQRECAGKWKDIFGNDSPIRVEAGMGKGKFIHTMAKTHPDINYVGIEKYSSVLLRAVHKMEQGRAPQSEISADGCGRHCGGIRTGRGGQDIPELLRSVAQGQTCQKASSIKAISCAV